jgi:hypothetical protein
MIDPVQLHGKRVAMIARGKNEDGSDAFAVFSGVADWDGTRLILRRFPIETSLEIRREWFARIEPVPAGLKAKLSGAEFSFPVAVREIS